MKCNYLTVLLFLCMSSYGKEKTDLEVKDLKGPVAKLTEIDQACPKLVRYACILRTPAKPGYVTKHTTHVMDKLGRQAEVSCYNSDNKLIKKTYVTYNEHDYVTTVTEKDADGRLTNRVVYTYDAKNYPTEVDYYNAKDSLYNPINLSHLFFTDKMIAHFDATGKKIAEECYEENGKLLWKMEPPAAHRNEEEDTAPEVTYDYKGRKAKETSFYANGNIKCRIYFRYDNDDHAAGRSITFFDANGNEMLAQNYDADSTITTQTYTLYRQYDAKGNWHNKVQWTVNTDDFEFLYPRVYVVDREIAYSN